MRLALSSLAAWNGSVHLLTIGWQKMMSEQAKTLIPALATPGDSGPQQELSCAEATTAVAWKAASGSRMGGTALKDARWFKPSGFTLMECGTKSMGVIAMRTNLFRCRR